MKKLIAVLMSLCLLCAACAAQAAQRARTITRAKIRLRVIPDPPFCR